jgi:hypothetical protein
MRGMQRLAIAAALSIFVGGCYVRHGGHVHVTPLGAALAGTALANALSAPPLAIDVGYYGYDRPGYVWVNGRHSWNGSAWVWTPGYYQPERAGHYWVQGMWDVRGDQYVWIDGYWEGYRPGYVYVDGYYDYRDTGYVWMPGYWEAERPGYVYVQGSWSTHGGRRTWNHGSWRQRSTTAYSGSVHVRDHR